MLGFKASKNKGNENGNDNNNYAVFPLGEIMVGDAYLVELARRVTMGGFQVKLWWGDATW